MARLNVYVPDDLHSRLLASGIGGPAIKGGRAINVSALIREPLERALAGEAPPPARAKAQTIGYNIRLPHELHRSLAAQAAGNGHSLHYEILAALQAHAGHVGTFAAEPVPSICPCPRCSPTAPEGGQG